MEEKLLKANKESYKNLTDKQDELVNELEKDFLNRYTYDAVSLEGRNKVTYEKVTRILGLKDKTGYSEREIKEVLNHAEAYRYVLKLTKKQNRLTEEDIKDIHQMLEEGIVLGGVYRNVNIQIPGAIHQPPNNVKVYDRMKRLFDDIKEKEYDYLDEGLLIHATLAKIHPFLDANGRLSRLVLNFYLIKAGYLPISIKLDKRDEYFKTLEEFKVNKDINPLKTFILNLLNERYDEEILKLQN